MKLDQRKAERVRNILLEMKDGDLIWPWLHDDDGEVIQRLNKKRANKFLLGCIIDYQMRAGVAWDNARRLAEQELGDPDDLWECIGSHTKKEWMALRPKYKWLHRFPQAHYRVWRIAREVRDNHGGDARNIWKDADPGTVNKRLKAIRLGPQLSKMAVGALTDTGHLRGCSDVKADLNLRRVLGRVFGQTDMSDNDVTRTTRLMFPKNPWTLDGILFKHGRKICTARPVCNKCKLRSECSYSYP